MLCGMPSSGKTTLANKLVDYFKDEHKKVVRLICDGNFINNKNSLYPGTFQMTIRKKSIIAMFKIF